MNKILAFILVVAFCSTAWSSCSIPTSPRNFPNGSTASLDEMKRARQESFDFQDKLDSYRYCIKDEYEKQLNEHRSDSEAVRKEIWEGYRKQDNAAMDEKLRVVNSLNEQMNAYRAAHPSSEANRVAASVSAEETKTAPIRQQPSNPSVVSESQPKSTEDRNSDHVIRGTGDQDCTKVEIGKPSEINCAGGGGR